jgi:hypothetical protein
MALVAAVFALGAAAAVIAARLGGDSGAAAVVVGMPCALAAVIASLRRRSVDPGRLNAALDNHFRQVEALLSLYATLEPRAPLPATRGWSACPDLLLEAVKEIQLRRPRLVVECGSGVSTVVLGLALKRLAGAGRLVALEHDPEHAEQTRAWLRANELTEVCEVVFAPLTAMDIGGTTFAWYDLERARAAITEPVGLLLVDGPPGKPGVLARYPALPALSGNLADDSVVLLDDGDRAEEQEITERWGRESGWSVEPLLLERRAFRLSRRKSGRLGP